MPDDAENLADVNELDGDIFFNANEELDELLDIPDDLFFDAVTEQPIEPAIGFAPPLDAQQAAADSQFAKRARASREDDPEAERCSICRNLFTLQEGQEDLLPACQTHFYLKRLK